jgi:hypothetical protein
MDATPRTALVDESFRHGHDGRGCSLLAAVIAPDASASTIEHDLRRFVNPGQRRFHWHDEKASSRRRFLETIAEYHQRKVVAIAYCQETASHRKIEQARVRSIWALLADLNDRGVGTLVFESRQERNDRKDRREVVTAQKAGLADPDLVYRHGRPKEEPLLWLPDAVAGTVGEYVANDNSEFLELLPAGMCEVRWLNRP